MTNNLKNLSIKELEKIKKEKKEKLKKEYSEYKKKEELIADILKIEEQEKKSKIINQNQNIKKKLLKST